MMAEAGVLDQIDETFREYERVVDPKYLDEIRAAAKQFSTKLLSRQAQGQSMIYKTKTSRIENGAHQPAVRVLARTFSTRSRSGNPMWRRNGASLC